MTSNIKIIIDKNNIIMLIYTYINYNINYILCIYIYNSTILSIYGDTLS